MGYTYLLVKKNQLFFLIFLLFISMPLFAFAFAFPQPHGVITLGLGIANSSDVGKSQSFPIQNPLTDLFYNYSVTQASQTRRLIDEFIGLEWVLSKEYKLQLGLDYNQSPSFSVNGILTQGADVFSTDTFNYHYRISTKQVLFLSKLFYTFREKYHPYVLVGIGAAFNDAFNYYTTISEDLSFTRLYANNSVTTFSYTLGMGIERDISSNLRIGIGYRFVDLGKVALGNAMIDTSSASGKLSQDHLYTNELLAQFSWLIY